jgi:DNA ligase D-like protein (predicted ligase)
MLLLATSRLPESSNLSVEIKFDGFRALAFKSGGRVRLRSRNDKDFVGRYPAIAQALTSLPDETVIDGEIVALDRAGKPSFNALQNYGSAAAPVFFYVFDVLVLSGKEVMGEPLSHRRELLETKVLPLLSEPIRYSPVLDAPLADLIESVKTQGLEGLVAKRLDSKYEPGERSGAWLKMRVNQSQEFVIGGYTPSAKNFDALVIGVHRNGFTPASRAQLFKKLKPFEVTRCPFANLPESHSGRWGVGLTVEKMKDCRWVEPRLTGLFEFVEETPDRHLRHCKFVSLRDDAGSSGKRRP